MSNGNGQTVDISSLLTRSIPRPTRLDEQFAIAPNDPVAPTFRRLMPTLELRFQSLENQRPDFEKAIRELRDASVVRIDDVLLPAIEKVRAYTEHGWFLVRSNTEITLTVNADRLFIINEGVQRDLFAPTPFLAIQRQGSPDDYAFARLSAYHRLGGFLHVRILAVWGNPGPHTDWTITSAPGIAEGTRYWFERTYELGNKAEVEADRATAQADRAETNADRSQVNRDWMDQVRDQLTESGIDTSAFSWRDGSRPFIGVVSGVAPAGTAAAGELVTASWTRARLNELGGGGNLLPAANPTFTGVLSGPEMRLSGTAGATTRNAAGRLSLSAGGFWNGTAFQASAAQASVIDQFNGEITFNANSGLSTGQTFTPTAVARVSSAGLNVLQGGLLVGGTNINTVYAPLANPNFTGTIRVNGQPMTLSANVPQAVSPSGTAVDGDLWFDTAGLSLFIRFNGQWVPAMGVMTLAYAPLANPPSGQNNYAPISAPIFGDVVTLTQYNSPALAIGTNQNNWSGILQAGSAPNGFFQIAHGARGSGTGSWIATDVNAQILHFTGNADITGVEFYANRTYPLTIGAAFLPFKIFEVNYNHIYSSGPVEDYGAWSGGYIGADLGLWGGSIYSWGQAVIEGRITCGDLGAYGTVSGARLLAGGNCDVGNQLSCNSIYCAGVAQIHQVASNAWYMWDTHMGNLWAFQHDGSGGGNMTWHSYTRGRWFELRHQDAALINWQGVTFSHGFADLCDIRSKTNIEPDHHGLDVIARLNPIDFDQITVAGTEVVPFRAPRRRLGFSAQEVMAALPEAAAIAGIEMPDGSGGLDSAEPSLAVSVTALVAVCVNAIKELSARVETLEQRRN